MDQNINQKFEFLIDYGNQGELLYGLNNEKIFRLKKLLEKRHPLFFSTCKNIKVALLIPTHHSSPMLVF